MIEKENKRRREFTQEEERLKLLTFQTKVEKIAADF